jgi:Flp pilus assembly protein TadD
VSNKPVYSQTEQLRYAFGSGAHGQTYVLVREGGYFFEAPVTWYRELDGLSMSPGYEDAGHSRFARPVTHDCVFCHTGSSRPIAGSQNRYDEQRPFDEIAIGCERCHGPGHDHVQGSAQAGSIINPAKLGTESAAVCFQCHRSEGEIISVLRPGRSWHDFRPGTPLADFIQQFDASTGEKAHAGLHFGGKFTQLHASRCYQESGGKLQCISCHSVHSRPDPQSRALYYRQKCLECHQLADCGMPVAVRIEANPEDSCYRCHMPETRPVEIRHATITDHRIRNPKEMASSGQDRESVVDLTALAGFDAPPREFKRNVGLAYLHRSNQPSADRDRSIQMALSALNEVRQDYQQDVPFLLARGKCLVQLGVLGQAVSEFQAAVRIEPNNEDARLELAQALWMAGRKDEARAEFGIVRQLDPYQSYMLHSLGGLEAQRLNWRAAEQLYRAALLQSRGDERALFELGRILMRLGKTDEGMELLRRYEQATAATAGLKENQPRTNMD